MQARATGQTSKLGECLDHWLDGMHSSAVAAASSLVAIATINPYLGVAFNVSFMLVYYAETIVQLHTSKFPPVPGVEAHVATIIAMLVGSLLWAAYPQGVPNGELLATIFASIVLAVTFFIYTAVLKEFESAVMWFAAILFVAIQWFIGMFFCLHWVGAGSYSWLAVMITFRMGGERVVNALRGYKQEVYYKTVWLYMFVFLGMLIAKAGYNVDLGSWMDIMFWVAGAHIAASSYWVFYCNYTWLIEFDKNKKKQLVDASAIVSDIVEDAKAR